MDRLWNELGVMHDSIMDEEDHYKIKDELIYTFYVAARASRD